MRILNAIESLHIPGKVYFQGKRGGNTYYGFAILSGDPNDHRILVKTPSGVRLSLCLLDTCSGTFFTPDERELSRSIRSFDREAGYAFYDVLACSETGIRLLTKEQTSMSSGKLRDGCGLLTFIPDDKDASFDCMNVNVLFNEPFALEDLWDRTDPRLRQCALLAVADNKKELSVEVSNRVILSEPMACLTG